MPTIPPRSTSVKAPFQAGLPDRMVITQTPAMCQNCLHNVQTVKHNPDNTVYTSEGCKFGLLPPLLPRSKYQRAKYCVAHKTDHGS